MEAYNQRKWMHYTTIVEHFFRVAIRKRLPEVRGEVARKWHQDTVHWFNEKCTEEERKLMIDFYTCCQSVRDCRNYKLKQRVFEISERYACDMGLWAIEEREGNDNG